ncbi:MAG: gliding motility-associated C-terminal domain-containing protein [Flavobacteriales bacterium]
MKIALRIFHVLMVFSFAVLTSSAQDILLLTEDFENGAGAFTMNDGSLGSNTGNNLWTVNDIYDGAPDYPNTTDQNNTNGGTIGFAPYSNYLHIYDQASGINNANYDPTSVSDRFTYMTFGLCTYGMVDVHFSFFYLCEGSANSYGTIYYSLDNGPWVSVGDPQYSNQSNWQYVDITDPAFENVGSLRFGFRWENGSGSMPSSESFAVDDINIVATFSTIDPVTIDILSVAPNPVCQGAFLTIEWALSDTLCDGNYQIEISNSSGNFPSPFGTWVMGINYPQTTGFATIQVPSNAAPGDCYRIRINRLAPPPEITGVSSDCFEIMECPNIITTLQPVVTMDTNAVCIGSVIDIPFTSTGVYTNNTYIAQLSNPDGTFPLNPLVVGTSPDNSTYDPMLGQLPGNVSGQIPETEPGCNYYIRIISTNPDAIGSLWGPFCIQECDLETNNREDLNFCLHDCATDPDGENMLIDITVNNYDDVAEYLPGNEFTTQFLSSMTFGQIGDLGIFGSVAAVDDTTLNIHIPCIDSLADYGIPPGMNYLRIVATNSTTPDNALGTLIRLSIGLYRDEPLVITSYEYPLMLPRDTFCVGETAMLSFQPYNYNDNSTFMWQCNAINGGQPFESPSGANSNSLYVTLGGPGILTFKVQETNFGCVSEWSALDTIVVLGDPISFIGGPTQVCEGDTVHYQVQFYPNTYYSWSTNAELGELLYQDTSNNEMNIAFSEVGSYQLSINVLNQCGSASDTHNVNVLGIPEVDVGDDALICINDTVTLSSATAPGYTFNWISGNIQVGTSSSIEVSPEISTEYIATVTGTGGCQNQDTVLVEVQYPEPAEVFYDSLCPGGLNQLNLTAEEDGNYVWSTGEFTEMISVQDTGTYVLSTYMDGLLCPFIDNYIILPLQPEPAEWLTDSICPGGDNELTLTAPGAGSYLWSTEETSSSIVINDIGNYGVGIYTPNEVCPELYMFNILPMEPDSAINLIDSVCPGGQYPIILESDTLGSYVWSNGEYSSQILVNDTGVYVLQIFSTNTPCPRTLQYTIIPDTCYGVPELFVYVPNTFTPDADGINDVFGPVFSDESLLAEYRILIFDRWGDIVFESTHSYARWTGNFKGGQYYVKDDVYVYQIEYRQIDVVEGKKIVGHVSMLR